jgi:hypothetical protein
MPVAEKPQMESILDKRVSKRTRRKEYFEYLVKWKSHPVEDASWESESEIQKHDAGASQASQRGDRRQLEKHPTYFSLKMF